VAKILEHYVSTEVRDSGLGARGTLNPEP
jgi:hypothetical protein